MTLKLLVVPVVISNIIDEGVNVKPVQVGTSVTVDGTTTSKVINISDDITPY
jgi:hypothetical protein